MALEQLGRTAPDGGQDRSGNREVSTGYCASDDSRHVQSAPRHCLFTTLEPSKGSKGSGWDGGSVQAARGRVWPGELLYRRLREIPSRRAWQYTGSDRAGNGSFAPELR